VSSDLNKIFFEFPFFVPDYFALVGISDLTTYVTYASIGSPVYSYL
jgi:hypothetical protein